MMTDRRMRRGGATIRQRAGRVLVVRGGDRGRVVGRRRCCPAASRSTPAVAVSSRDPSVRCSPRPCCSWPRGSCCWARQFGRAVRLLAGGRRRRRAPVAARRRWRSLVIAIAWNTRAAGGSDSSCYVLQAEAFARGARHARQSRSPTCLPGATPAAAVRAGRFRAVAARSRARRADLRPRAGAA